MKDSGKMWLIPGGLHPPIEQAAVVVKNSQKKEAAKAFIEYIKSAAGKAVMDKYGFTTPPAGRSEGEGGLMAGPLLLSLKLASVVACCCSWWESRQHTGSHFRGGEGNFWWNR